MRTKEEQEAINKACKYHPETREELKKLVHNLDVNLGDIDTSEITNMQYLFFCSEREDFSGIEKWDISKSKTATNLDANYESKVTLSLPSAEEQLETDVVFVLDESSCSDQVKVAVVKMLENLYQQIKDTNAAIKIGAVQFRGEVTKLPLTVLK